MSSAKILRKRFLCRTAAAFYFFSHTHHPPTQQHIASSHQLQPLLTFVTRCSCLSLHGRSKGVQRLRRSINKTNPNSPHSLTDHRSLTHLSTQTNTPHLLQSHSSNTAIMADSLNMNGLSLRDSQHASQPGAPQQNGNGYTERAAYIPPHLRNRPAPQHAEPNGYDGGPAPMSNGMNDSAWAPK